MFLLITVMTINDIFTIGNYCIISNPEGVEIVENVKISTIYIRAVSRRQTVVYR